MGVQKGSYDFKQFVLGGFLGDNRNMPLYSRFDEIAKEFFRARQIPILDVEPLYYRQDNHPGKDIHQCAHGNGALRLIPRLLQTLIWELDHRRSFLYIEPSLAKKRRSSTDVRRDNRETNRWNIRASKRQRAL